jgi:hypothetical protein
MHTPHPILWPVMCMVLITAATWFRLYFERIGEMRKRRISPQRIASRRMAADVLENTRAADHLANLFEMPALFYVLCMSLAITDLETPVFLAGAWAFVFLRAVHTSIHLLYNRVLHRFMAYAASSLVLFLLWVLFAWQCSMA